jgi:hypothetical protein
LYLGGNSKDCISLHIIWLKWKRQPLIVAVRETDTKIKNKEASKSMIIFKGSVTLKSVNNNLNDFTYDRIFFYGKSAYKKGW